MTTYLDEHKTKNRMIGVNWSKITSAGSIQFRKKLGLAPTQMKKR
jgi:hypothetical protein